MQDMQVGRSGTSEAAFTPKPDCAMKMQSFPFICNETPTGPAAVVMDFAAGLSSAWSRATVVSHWVLLY